MALRRRIYLEPQAVGRRSAEYPIVRDLAGERLQEVLAGKNRRADSAPMLLQLLERDGANSAGMLRFFDEVVAHFDEASLPGWDGWRRSLGALDRSSFLSRYFELLVASWFAAAGFVVKEFEPEGAPGKRADLRVAVEGDEWLVEATQPGPHQNDWVENAMDHLTLALSRVESGLVVDVAGYESLTLTPGEGWSVNPEVPHQSREDLVTEFARSAEHLDPAELPFEVVSSRDGQPISITAVEYHEELARETVIRAGWSRSGLVPNVNRLAEKILDERKHLPDDPASLILVDLSRWLDFSGHADYYLRQVAEEVAGRTRPAVFVGTCVGRFYEGVHRLIERGIVACDADWAGTPAAMTFLSKWGGTDFTVGRSS